jgi:hypothetical protein
MDHATGQKLYDILRRESRSLMRYLHEVPPWVGLREQNALARLRESAAAEAEVTDRLSKRLHKIHSGLVHLGAFPDFTPYNDAALHFLLPIVIREQKQLLHELEKDRAAVADAEAAAMLDELLALKRQHAEELAALATVPHSKTVVSV